METLIETKVTSGYSPLPTPASRGAAAFFAQKDRLTRWCILTTLASVVCALISLCLTLAARTQEIRFVVLDPAGNVFVMPGRTFDQAKELHTEQALLATTSLLLRNPAGFDLPELLQTLFVANALNQAVSLKANEAAEFQEKQLHQHPLVSRVNVLEIRPDAVRMEIAGQVVRNGVFQQQPFTEVLPFTLNLLLRNNPDLLRNRRQPTVVVEFDLKYEMAR